MQLINRKKEFQTCSNGIYVVQQVRRPASRHPTLPLPPCAASRRLPGAG